MASTLGCEARHLIGILDLTDVMPRRSLCRVSPFGEIARGQYGEQRDQAAIVQRKRLAMCFVGGKGYRQARFTGRQHSEALASWIG